MAMSGGSDDGSPMMDMNTTPLIDVMLVLLIMFIITIPVATHSVDIDLPVPSDEPVDIPIDPIKNRVFLTKEGQILWNGTPTDGQGLATLLDQTKGITPEPELQYEPAQFAAYEDAVLVLNIIKNSGVTKFGFVGNERYRVFGKDGSGVNPTIRSN